MKMSKILLSAAALAGAYVLFRRKRRIILQDR